MAKKGVIMQAHFAHESGADCAGGYESAVHLAIKEIIQELKSIHLPECNYALYPGQDGEIIQNYMGRDPRKSYRSLDHFEDDDRFMAFAHIPGRTFTFQEVHLEVNLGDVRPDIVCSAGDKKLFIEVAFSHFVDAIKLAKLTKRGISTLEIDVSAFRAGELSKDVLKSLILENNPNKKWLLNAHAKTLAAIDEPLRKARLDARQKIKDTREARIQDQFGSTHEVTYKFDQHQTIVVKLCRQYTGISIKPSHTMTPPLARMAKLMEMHQGIYIEKYRKWQFPPSKELFFSLATAFNHDCNCIKLHCPPEEQKDYYPQLMQRNPLFENELNPESEPPAPRLPRDNHVAVKQTGRPGPGTANQSKRGKIFWEPDTHLEDEDAKVILYYSTQADFMSIPAHTAEEWQECQLSQSTRKSLTHPGWYYVDFVLESYLKWLGEKADTHRHRLLWAHHNLIDGWPVP